LAEVTKRQKDNNKRDVVCGGLLVYALRPQYPSSVSSIYCMPKHLTFHLHITHTQNYILPSSFRSTSRITTVNLTMPALLHPLIVILPQHVTLQYCYNVFQSEPLLHPLMMFVNDTNLFLSNSNMTDLITKINEELSNISIWLKLNKLSLNIKKTHYMLFHVRQKKLIITSRLKLTQMLLIKLNAQNFLVL